MCSALVIACSGCTSRIGGGRISGGHGSGVDAGGVSCNECEVGATGCSGTGVQTCLMGDDGCARWSDRTDCTGYDTCQSGACVPSCAPAWLTNNKSWTQNNKTYRSSGNALYGHDATQLLDNNMSTYWSAGYGGDTDQWIIFDLGAPVTLSGFRAANSSCCSSYAKDVVVQTGPALDGPWTDVKSFELAKIDGFQSSDFDPTKSQYWRLFIKNNWGYVYYVNLLEVGFFGCM